MKEGEADHCLLCARRNLAALELLISWLSGSRL